MSPKKVTGIYGGSFNPVHIGHTTFASELVGSGVVDEMWLVVSPQNPLKQDGLWDDELRLQLARVAVADAVGVEVSDIEFSLPRPSYMLTTLGTLRERYQDREFVLVIGQDNWDSFHSWYCWQEIMANYKIVVIPRNLSSIGKQDTVILPLMNVANGVLKPIQGKNVRLIDMSSTWIRCQIESNPDYNGQGLHPNVWEIIRQRRALLL